ncbi:hypothetical protein RB620_10860 [Paenibacillus sp. LHD-117]|uniref:hypothetical protein n=1 Tax=Paenibacillus sp. LHD-117 TaxID=3071412 RepID=UPI0027E12181|nr:hypothetical protein [Paenibacillus sp. LHD-117]MDQ6419934.1 hypothetical protein [Paenibacillus sp. LHD-117]
MDLTIKIIKNVLFILPALFGTHVWLYGKNPKYYFFVVRLFSKWRDTTWAVNVDFKLSTVDGAYIKVEDVFKELYINNRYKRVVNMKNKKVYECGLFNIIVQDDFDSGVLSENKLNIRIAQINVTTNTAEEKLRELREFFNKLSHALVPVSQSYHLDVQFENGKNPFYGLMVQRLGRDNVLHFECVFPISAIVPKNNGNDRNPHYLRIFKEKLCINESSFDILEETAKRALLFK